MVRHNACVTKNLLLESTPGLQQAYPKMQMGSNRARKISAGSSVQCVVCRHTGFDVIPIGHRYIGPVGRRPSKANLLQTRLRDNANGLLRFAGTRRRRGKEKANHVTAPLPVTHNVFFYVERPSSLTSVHVELTLIVTCLALH